MAVKSREEIMVQLNQIIGENNDDVTLTFIGDLTDTISDYETRLGDTTNWKEKYETNDAEWRKKYRERFFSGEGNPEPEPEPDPPDNDKKLTFESLFKTE